MNGIILNESNNTDILHTTIYKTRAHGIIMSKSPGTTIKNNIIFAGGPSGNALYIGDTLSTNELKLDYNCYLNFISPILIFWAPINGKFPTFWDYRNKIKQHDVHSISDDPMFVSTEQYAEDFNLRPESPCIGKAEDGNNIGAIFSK
jgi:parallel beta-helix repeat protein